MKKLCSILVTLLVSNILFAQYTVNGNASRDNCHCYTLTPNAGTQSGSVWNNNKIDLNQSFDFNFNIFLGCNDGGADGIAFVLQPISTSVGSSGGGLGFSGVTPSVGLTIDTWQNAESNDPAYDHLAIQLNGDIDHGNTGNNLAGPVPVFSTSDNIEDCQWHVLRIQWNASTKTFQVYLDGDPRLGVVNDFVTNVFGGNPQVFWGFTGSTGGAQNLQQFCTALTPAFNFLPTQKRCINEPITFYDATVSFTTLQKRYWSFGDGSPVDSVNLNPVHRYAAAGNYTVTQTVIGADGCSEINTQQVIVGSKPIPNFGFTNVCAPDQPFTFSDSSTASFGTINNWYWDLGDTLTVSNLQSPSKVYQYPGLKTVRLAVRSLEGCTSDTISKQIRVFAKPTANFTFTDNQCLGVPVQFNGLSTAADGTIAQWNWNMDVANPAIETIRNPTHAYTTPGPHQVSFNTVSSNGCVSPVITKTITILEKPVAALKMPSICQSVPVTIMDSSYSADGSAMSGWWWSLGNGSMSNVQNPRTTYNTGGDITIQLVVRATNNCLSDTLKQVVTIQSTPVANFGYSSPLCAGQPIQFSDSSIVSSGTIAEWLWIFDNTDSSTMQSPSRSITAGNHQVKLQVKNAAGCPGVAVTKTFTVDAEAAFTTSFTDACTNTAIDFNATNTGTVAISQWLWTFGDVSFSVVKDTQHIYTVEGIYPVTLTVTTVGGCTYADTSNITIYSTDANAGNDTIAAVNQPIRLNASGGDFYEWTPAGGLSDANVGDPIATNSADRTYYLRAYTAFGCETRDTLNIKVFVGPQLYVPTAFAPNSNVFDNKILYVFPVGISRFERFTVYNRFGQIVFTTTDPKRGWDGNVKGNPQKAGAYIWIATATSYGGGMMSRKGTVMLVR